MLEHRSVNRLTPLHQLLYAHELTLKRASGDMRKMDAPLSSAKVDLNPHQIDAALFAFKCPMSKGAILCDEVGLGKTIEAGLIICQLWSEGKRKIIVVVPASLRKQWQNELIEKFGIPCVIVDGAECKKIKKGKKTNPFGRDKVVIVSIPFAAKNSGQILAVGKWDLAVIDEAHRLRNVYKREGSKQAKTLKELFSQVPKILLTATPLQNSLLELYGLVSFIDSRLFGSEYAFRTKFMADNEGIEAINLETLKERLSSVAVRSIRRQVQEYIPYTNRISFVEDFTPTDEEVRLYDLVSKYLQRPRLAAIRTSQRHLMILIYRKILASSSFAISKTLQCLVDHVGKKLKGQEPQSLEELVGDVDGYEEEKEEIEKEEEDTLEGDDVGAKKEVPFTKKELRTELSDLLSMKSLAESIHKNAKGDALLVAIEKAFSHARKLGWSEKTVIFTESRRTQEYLLKLLSLNGYKDQITVFNGTNNGPIAKRAFALWQKERTRYEGEGLPSKDAVIREALIHEFKNHTKIFISTEAGAEGINLQFCNIVINYDLPWNPQRVEQRIGRCHRYGQKNDVVVLNFINRKNAADQRVFELLDSKFKLFNGVFGASDEILGAIGSGVDFERRILDIYQSCRSEAEITEAFNELQEELAEKINQRMLESRAKLIEHFDDEVRVRFKVIDEKIRVGLSAMDLMLSNLVVSALDINEFKMTDGCCFFEIKKDNGKQNKIIEPGSYYIGRFDEQTIGIRLHIAHPIVRQLIADIKNSHSDSVHHIKLCYTKGNHKISQLEPYLGKSGVWATYKVTFEGLETEEHLIHIVLIKENDKWIVLGQELADKFASIMAEATAVEHRLTLPDESFMEASLTDTLNGLSQKISEKNQEYYDTELDKLEIYIEEALMRLHDEFKKKEEELAKVQKRKQRAATFEERQVIRKEVHKIELAYSHLVDKIVLEKKRLFEEKEKEIKKFEKKLELKIQKTCVAKALWVME